MTCLGTSRRNAHNRFLFTPVGLSCSESAKEYTVHFLCPSNTAPPLEMAEGIVEQIEISQQDGIWKWAGMAGVEETGLILAMTMTQQVKVSRGASESNKPSSDYQLHASTPLTPYQDGLACSPTPSTPASPASLGPPTSRRRMAASISRSSQFIHLGYHVMRRKQKQKPSNILTMLDSCMRTKTGIKGTFQLHFLESILNSYKNRRSHDAKQ
ncbi:hypothetical protein BJ165DRAFT_1408231 [Panaeolus papilionaceus]|nr:hypothetical protein BJ165DRAFT_1408231 [Panaeolus papilionaceus]